MEKNPDKMKVLELKNELRSRKLKTTGKKSELIERLKAAKLLDDAHVREDDDAPDDDENVEDDDASDKDDDIEEEDDLEDDHDSISSKNNNSAGRRVKKIARQNDVSFKDIDGMIRSFTGEDNFSVDKWIEEFEGVATLLNLSKLQQLVFAKKSLQGLAKIYAQTEVFTSWEKLKQGLRDEFERKSTSRELHQELASRIKKQNESTQEYLIMMREIASKGCIDDESLIQYVIDGINDSSANKAILYGAATLAEFKMKLKLYDKIKGSTTRRAATVVSQHSLPKGKESQQEFNRQKSSNERRCYNCGEKSHSSSNCPHKEKGAKCFRCNEFGHKSAQCPAVSDRQVQFLGQRNMMMAHICGHDLDALIDTGSSPNLMKKRCHETIKGPPLNATAETFSGANGVLIHPIGRFRSKVKLNGEEFDTVIHVVPDSTMKHSVIIGDDLLRDAVLLVTPDTILVEKAKPHILSINFSESTEPAINIAETASPEGRKKVEAMVAGCRPNKSKSTDVGMIITLKDKTPIWHHPRRLSPKDPTKCYQKVRELQQTVNSTYQRSIGMTPFELLTGIPMKTKSAELKLAVEEEIRNSFIEDREELRKEAKAQLVKVQNENRHGYNLRRKAARQYNCGDLVAIKRIQPGSKLKPKFVGPYKIVNVKAGNSYEVVAEEETGGPRTTSTCAEYMKPWPTHTGRMVSQNGRNVGFESEAGSLEDT